MHSTLLKVILVQFYVSLVIPKMYTNKVISKFQAFLTQGIKNLLTQKDKVATRCIQTKTIILT